MQVHGMELNNSNDIDVAMNEWLRVGQVIHRDEYEHSETLWCLFMVIWFEIEQRDERVNEGR